MAKKETQSANNSVTFESGHDLSTYFAILNGIQEQIRFADSKAAFLSALNALMFAFLSNGIYRLNAASNSQGAAFRIAALLMVLYVLAAAFSVGLVVLSVMSRFGELAPKSKVYFGHIIQHYGKDYSKYVAEMKAMNNDSWATEIGTQIVEVSHIAVTKHNLLRTAAMLSLVAFVLWVAALFALAFVPVPPVVLPN